MTDSTTPPPAAGDRMRETKERVLTAIEHGANRDDIGPLSQDVFRVFDRAASVPKLIDRIQELERELAEAMVDRGGEDGFDMAQNNMRMTGVDLAPPGRAVGEEEEAATLLEALSPDQTLTKDQAALLRIANLIRTLSARAETARATALEVAAVLVEKIVVSGPEDDEIDHDDYRDMQIAAAIRALKEMKP